MGTISRGGTLGGMVARVLTAVVGIPLLVFVALSGSIWVVAIGALAIGCLCATELSIRDRGRYSKPIWRAIAICTNLILSFWITWFWIAWDDVFFDRLRFVLTLVATVGVLGLPRFPKWLDDSGAWIVLPVWCFLQIGQLGLSAQPSMELRSGSSLLLLFLCLWAGDTAAFFVGKAIGRHKLAPNISPNKTWEGAIANLLAAVAVGWFAARWNGLTPQLGLCVGLIVGVFGQVGDLYESAWKRSLGIKDSGNLLPGHGGVLDRFDSLLFAAPPVAALLYSGWLR